MTVTGDNLDAAAQPFIVITVVVTRSNSTHDVRTPTTEVTRSSEVRHQFSSLRKSDVRVFLKSTTATSAPHHVCRVCGSKNVFSSRRIDFSGRSVLWIAVRIHCHVVFLFSLCILIVIHSIRSRISDPDQFSSVQFR